MYPFETFFNELKNKFIEHFLLISFSFVIILALSFPFPGIYLSSLLYQGKSIIQLINTFLVFFISGISLSIEEFHDFHEYLFVLFYGIISINLLTTFLAPFFLNCFPISVLSSSFQLGLAIFACVPTTLGVGVTLTQLAKGNVLLSLMLTLITNILGTITTPFLLELYLTYMNSSTSSSSSSENDGKIDSIGLLIVLLMDVLLPTILGIMIRIYIPMCRNWCQMYKKSLSMFSTLNLAMIIWMALSQSRDILFQQSIQDFFIVLVTVIMMHVFYLLMNYCIASKYCCNFEVTQAVSIIIMTSQKSNPVALAVINGMGLKNPGLVILPGILGQLAQIFIGSFLAGYLKSWVESSDKSSEGNTPTAITSNAGDDDDDDDDDDLSSNISIENIEMTNTMAIENGES